MGAPFYPTSAFVIEKMLAMAGVNSESIVYDLGCGNGDIIVAAARQHDALKAVGIEQDQKLFNQLQAGSKVVSHDFGIPGWRPAEFHVLKEGHRSERVIVYVIGSRT